MGVVVLGGLGEVCAEGDEAVAEPRFHRAERDTSGAGGFGVGEPVEVRQLQDFPVRL